MPRSKVFTFTAYKKNKTHGQTLISQIKERELFEEDLDMVVGGARPRLGGGSCLDPIDVAKPPGPSPTPIPYPSRGQGSDPSDEPKKVKKPRPKKKVTY